MATAPCAGFNEMIDGRIEAAQGVRKDLMKPVNTMEPATAVRDVLC